MSAILSADDLNDFISPGVACIKPVETLPQQKNAAQINPYEVTTEDQIPSEPPPPAQISLTDCLACSGCVTSAETILVSLQSHAEVLNVLDSAPQLLASAEEGSFEDGARRKLFIASVSPQVRASVAATYDTTGQEAGWMIEQLLCGNEGMATGGKYRNRFSFVVDTNLMREANLVLSAEEVLDQSLALEGQETRTNDTAQDFAMRQRPHARTPQPKKPILSSACPGWICYAEKTHPHVLPHLSTLKSPQALTGTLLKTILSQAFGIHPSQIYHLSIMPCFDKKLEASRQELTNIYWRPSSGPSSTSPSTPSTDQDSTITDECEIPALPVRDVDCVITPRELLMLASSRNISFPSLPRFPLRQSTPFPDAILSKFLFPPATRRRQSRYPSSSSQQQNPSAGSSGGYLWHILQTQRERHPGSTIQVTRGRNADVVTYQLLPAASSLVQSDSLQQQQEEPIFQAARYYGFRNIQNLVRKLQPARPSRLAHASSSFLGRSSAATSAGGGARKPTMPAKGRRPPSNTVTKGSPAIPSNGNADTSKLDYVEVMACPGGCTNGGGQIRVEDLGEMQIILPKGWRAEGGGVGLSDADKQRLWKDRVESRYFGAGMDSDAGADMDARDEDRRDREEEDADSGVDLGEDGDVNMQDPTTFPSADTHNHNHDLDPNPTVHQNDTEHDVFVNGINHTLIHRILKHWSETTGLDIKDLTRTTYRAVESDVGKDRGVDTGVAIAGPSVEAVVGREGGGW
ncbi:Cytosolic Fe-S cluster assembly factor nar1 [Agyrium rufum]|nr:Cytosolic Fe-S cluster assembly factor nar1 [Agyrium rufum]